MQRQHKKLLVADLVTLYSDSVIVDLLTKLLTRNYTEHMLEQHVYKISYVIYITSVINTPSLLTK